LAATILHDSPKSSNSVLNNCSRPLRTSRRSIIQRPTRPRYTQARTWKSGPALYAAEARHGQTRLEQLFKTAEHITSIHYATSRATTFHSGQDAEEQSSDMYCRGKPQAGRSRTIVQEARHGHAGRGRKSGPALCAAKGEARAGRSRTNVEEHQERETVLEQCLKIVQAARRNY
jgi:hypothetical protein